MTAFKYTEWKIFGTSHISSAILGGESPWQRLPAKDSVCTSEIFLYPCISGSDFCASSLHQILIMSS